MLQLEEHLQELVVVRGLLGRGSGGQGGLERVRGTGGENGSLLVQSLALVLADHVKETVCLCGIIFL